MGQERPGRPSGRILVTKAHQLTKRRRRRRHTRRPETRALNHQAVTPRRQARFRRNVAVPPSRSPPANRRTRMGLVHPLRVDLPTKSERVPPGPTRRMRCSRQVLEVVTPATGAPRASARTGPAVMSAAVPPSRLPARRRGYHNTARTTTRGPKGGCNVESLDRERKGPLK